MPICADPVEQLTRMDWPNQRHVAAILRLHLRRDTMPSGWDARRFYRSALAMQVIAQMPGGAA